MQTSLTVRDDDRVAHGMDIGNFDRNLYTTRKYVAKVIPLLTIELAQEMLERGGVVHNDSKAIPEQYAAMMAANKWKELTPDQIGFNWDGKLVNGRMRLLAVVKSGQPLHNVTICFGLDPDVAPAIDTGAGRKSKHLMRLAGVAKHLATPLAQGVKLHQRYMTAVHEGKLPRPSRFRPQDDYEFHMQHPKFLEVVTEIMGLKQTWKEVMPPSVAFSLAYMAVTKGHPQDVVLGFIKLLGNFEGQGPRHPALVLYKSLQKAKQEDGMRNPEDKLVKSIRAYNKWVRKGSMSNVRGMGTPDREFDGEETADDHATIPVVIQYSRNHHRDANSVN
jgi:hypothetical protein